MNTKCAQIRRFFSAKWSYWQWLVVSLPAVQSAIMCWTPTKSLDVKLSKHQIPIFVVQGNRKTIVDPCHSNQPIKTIRYYRFECPDFRSLDTNICHLKGRTYNRTVNDENLLPACMADCHCQQGKFICANVECPENFNPRIEGCVSQYDSLNRCCETSNICGNWTIHFEYIDKVIDTWFVLCSCLF